MAVRSPVPACAPSLTTHPTLHPSMLHPMSPLLDASATVPALYCSTQHLFLPRTTACYWCLYKTTGLPHKDKVKHIRYRHPVNDRNIAARAEPSKTKLEAGQGKFRQSLRPCKLGTKLMACYWPWWCHVVGLHSHKSAWQCSSSSARAAMGHGLGLLEHTRVTVCPAGLGCELLFMLLSRPPEKQPSALLYLLCGVRAAWLKELRFHSHTCFSCCSHFILLTCTMAAAEPQAAGI